jgi:hypothetical protein
MRKFAVLTIAVMALMAITVPAIAKPSHVAQNQPEYWEAQYEGFECFKVDRSFGTSYVADKDYSLVVLKGGPDNEVELDVGVGDELYAPDNPRSGEPYDISHIIFCEGDPLVS